MRNILGTVYGTVHDTVGVIVLNGDPPPWEYASRPPGLVHMDYAYRGNDHMVACGARRTGRDSTFLRRPDDITCPDCRAEYAAMLLCRAQ